MIQSLTEQFNKRYGNKFAEMNKNVYIASLTEGTFEIPVPTLGEGGGTVSVGKVPIKLVTPAFASVTHKRMEALYAVYRVAIQRSEAEIAANKPEYFNYLMDSIVQKAVINYNSTFGGIDKVRFGITYCTPYKEDGKSVFYETDDYIEFRLTGCWASDKEVAKVTLEGTTNE